jgi:hypothetical protein
MGDEDEKYFTDKNNDVDWQFMAGIKDGKLLERLIDADRASDDGLLKKLVAETEELYGKLASYKIVKDDSNLDVDNLIYMLQLMQAVMEVWSALLSCL